MRGGGFTPGILAVSALASAGCDPPLCRSEVFVAFAQPQILGDVDEFAPGVQAPVDVVTSLLPGDIVTLEVLDESGASRGAISRAVDASGGAHFDYVTLPTPHAVLRASGRGVCGQAHDEIMVDVPRPAMCELALSPSPDASAYFAPYGVLDLRGDPDPVTPGFQATLLVATPAGWTVEILRGAGAPGPGGTPSGGERTIGMFVAGDDGASVPVTVPDGWVGFRAICRGDGHELTSPPTMLAADTTPPGCELVFPPAGATITWDDDRDLADGVQFFVVGRTADGDVAGEPAEIAVSDARGAPAGAWSTTTGSDGSASDEITVMPRAMPARYTVALTMHDHAGNACTAIASYRVAVGGGTRRPR